MKTDKLELALRVQVSKSLFSSRDVKRLPLPSLLLALVSVRLVPVSCNDVDSCSHAPTCFPGTEVQSHGLNNGVVLSVFDQHPTDRGKSTCPTG